MSNLSWDYWELVSVTWWLGASFLKILNHMNRKLMVNFASKEIKSLYLSARSGTRE